MIKKGNLIILSGFLLITISLIILLQNCICDYHAYNSSVNTLHKIEEYFDSNDYANDPDYDEKLSGSLTNDPLFCFENSSMEMPFYNNEGYNYIGVLIIPSINCRLPVMSEFSYDYLNLSPCRYYGSVYQKNMVIAAHNYYSHFGYLNKLNAGDPVYFKDFNNNFFAYKVTLLETINPQDVEGMCSGDWDLTLFTCTFGGQYRTTVRCELVS